MPQRARLASTSLQTLLAEAKKQVVSDPVVPQVMSKIVLCMVAMQLRGKEYKSGKGMQLTYLRLIRDVTPHVVGVARKAYRATSEESRRLLRLGPERYIGTALVEVNALISSGGR